MTLIEVIEQLEKYPAGGIIYAARIDDKWLPDSRAEVISLSIFDEEPEEAPVGTQYFLELDL